MNDLQINRYFTFKLTSNWRIRLSIEHPFRGYGIADFAIELFSSFDSDNWSGIFLELCSICVNLGINPIYFKRREVKAIYKRSNLRMRFT